MTAEECINQLMSSNPFMKGGNRDKVNEYFNSLIELIEKQIPKRAKELENWGATECPNCGLQFGFNNPKYCDNCGQKLDWSAADE